MPAISTAPEPVARMGALPRKIQPQEVLVEAAFVESQGMGARSGVAAKSQALRNDKPKGVAIMDDRTNKLLA